VEVQAGQRAPRKPVWKLLAVLVAASIIWPAAAAAAGSHAIAVTATVLSSSRCTFGGGRSRINLVIDPSSAAPVTGTTSIAFRCRGNAPVASYTLSTNGGLYGASPSTMRMRHVASPANFLHYTLSYPTSGTTPRNRRTAITVTATVMPADFQDALLGNYSDTVTLSITP
jgi:spore coat protein U-like protein